MLELAESRAEESSLEDKSGKSLHQEHNCNEDFTCASVKQEMKSSSHYNSPEHYIGISSSRNAYEKHRLSTAAVMSNDAVISVPESLIVRLLQASGASIESLFGDTLAAKSNDITEDTLQQNSRTDPVNYVIVVFVNHGAQLRSSEEHTMHCSIYSGTFTRSALVEDEVVFVPCTEVELGFLLDFFGHLPKPFSCVIEDIGLHKIFCIRDQDHNSQFLGCELRGKAGRDLKKTNSVFVVENIIILQVPGVLLQCCLEQAAAVNSSSQKYIATRSFTHSNKEDKLLHGDSLSKKEVSNTCVAGQDVVTNEFKTSNIDCLRLGNSSGIFQGMSMCSKEEPQGPECAVTWSASMAFDELKQVAGEVKEENLNGLFTCEHHSELPLHESDKGRCFGYSDSIQWTVEKKLGSDDGNVCKCASKPSLDLDWREEAGQCHTDGASSGSAPHENIAHRILVELRSLSHSLLDVFDIIQRTPPLTKRTFLLPRELLSQHKVLHASTSSLESCPLAQSECFRLNEGSACDTKKRRKKKKKTSM